LLKLLQLISSFAADFRIQSVRDGFGLRSDVIRIIRLSSLGFFEQRRENLDSNLIRSSFFRTQFIFRCHFPSLFSWTKFLLFYFAFYCHIGRISSGGMECRKKGQGCIFNWVVYLPSVSWVQCNGWPHNGLRSIVYTAHANQLLLQCGDCKALLVMILTLVSSAINGKCHCAVAA